GIVHRLRVPRDVVRSPRGLDRDLAPRPVLSGATTQPVEDRRDVLVTVPLRHLPDDLDVLRGVFPNRGRLVHLEGGVDSTLPVDHEFQTAVADPISHHLFHDRAHYLLLDLDRTRRVVPDFLEPLAQGQYRVPLLVRDTRPAVCRLGERCTRAVELRQLFVPAPLELIGHQPAAGIDYRPTRG